MRNRIKQMVWVLLLSFLFAGCGTPEEEKEEKTERLPVPEEAFTYTVPEETDSLTVDENGVLYTVFCSLPVHGTEGQVLKEEERNYATQTFQLYDLAGNLISQKEVYFGTGPIDSMLIVDGMLYCTVDYNLEPYVYLIDTATWEVKELIKLTGYNYLVGQSKLVLLGDYLYILGAMKEAGTKDYMLHPDVFYFPYQGEQICRFNVTEEEAKLERMKVEFPISMYATDKNTLIIYQYTEEKGFGFLEFDPVEMTLEEQEWSHVNVPKENICGCGEGYTYFNEFKMYYGTVDGISLLISSDWIIPIETPTYQKGFLFYSNRETPGKVMRLGISDMIKKNTEIKILANEMLKDRPYSCGYRMSMEEVTAEEFALKVLAQDRDFDAYVLSSREDCSYNIKKNGAFYPLNKIEGVQEYLDACFPYVKEMAYNEDGDIWMVPVGLAIPGIAYNKALCAKNGVDYSKMDFLEFISFLEKVETETPELASMALIMLIEEFHMQYLSKYDSFDTELARTCLKRLREVYEKHGDWGINDVYGRSLVDDTIAEFYADYHVYNASVEILARSFGDSDAYGLTEVPRLSEDIGNVGTLTFLAVNPQSDHLEETLAYVSDFCKYMLTKQDSFLLAEESMYTDTPFIKEQYRLYANGDVNFRMEYEIFLEDFGAYLRGEKELEETIKEVERKRKLYVGE